MFLIESFLNSDFDERMWYHQTKKGFGLKQSTKISKVSQPNIFLPKLKGSSISAAG